MGSFGASPSLIAFDRLYHRGQDLRPRPLATRRNGRGPAALVEPDGRGHRYGAPRQGIVFRQWAQRNDALDSMGMPGAA